MTLDLLLAGLGCLCLLAAAGNAAAAWVAGMHPFAWPRRLRARNGLELEDFGRRRNYRAQGTAWLLAALVLFALALAASVAEL